MQSFCLRLCHPYHHQDWNKYEARKQHLFKLWKIHDKEADNKHGDGKQNDAQ
jgi:hypothetical protein